MKYVIIFVQIIMLSSCLHQKRQALSETVEEWIGKEILFPEKTFFTFAGNDTINSYPIKTFQHTIVSYVDSIGCIGCNLQLPMWKVFIKQLKELSSVEISIQIFLHPKNKNELLETLKHEKFDYPICIDENDNFNKLNNLPSEVSLQTFLLNSDNEVIAVGNPIHNPKVKGLYLKIIRGEKVKRERVDIALRTSIDIEKNSILLGNFDWKKEQKAIFTLRNVGNEILAIEDVNTSCGCTTVAYSKEPAQPGKELKLDVTYKADHPGYFNKTITVYCNTEFSPIKLKISGNAK